MICAFPSARNNVIMHRQALIRERTTVVSLQILTEIVANRY